MSSVPVCYAATFPIIPPWAIRITEGLVIKGCSPNDYNRRLHTIRLALSCVMTPRPCYEDQNFAPEIKAAIDAFPEYEEESFDGTDDFEEYRRAMDNTNIFNLNLNEEELKQKHAILKNPSLLCMSYMAVWKRLTTEEQESIALSPSFVLDPIRCLVTETLERQDKQKENSMVV